MTYDFTRFSTQSFERFVQAIAISKLGPITQIFGVGKDGAREATFEGKSKINSAEVWDGYVVVQAKYQETVGKSPENAAWLIRQIDAEMAKYEDASRSLRRPDYYIMASNTRLSAAAADKTGKGAGGIDSVEKCLTSWVTKLGLKGVALWHADTLSALLDAEPNIRTGYEFWVSPGDVLSAALSHLKDAAVETHLPGYLRGQLRKSRDVKTKDAGQTTGKRILLDDIFVDLPLDHASVLIEEFDEIDEDETEPVIGDLAVESNTSDPADVFYQDDDVEDFGGDYDYDEDYEEPLVVRMIVERCSDKFDNAEIAVGRRCRERVRNRIVLMGGPGQGKSTIGQFLAQIYRARLLESMPGNSPETRNIISSVLGRAAAEGVPLAGPARFPFLVDLPVYADALSKEAERGAELSLLSHIATMIAGGEEKITASTLRRWLGAVPSIFILDGLDEVPHSSNRSDVIEAINAFIDAMYEVNADCFTLVTSRPQGYQDELSRRTWVHWDMANLPSRDAIRFGEQLATILVSDEIRRQEIVDDLIRATKEDATAPLMTSPLQVSLLFALVETRNNIPKDRWTLFYRYYEILRDREIAKGGENGRLIGDYRSQIDRIHYETGYLLHLRGEKSGSANPFLELGEFATIVQEQLTRSGYDEGVELLTQKIVTLATTRLVFLRCRTVDHIAFDVRSLQEFMAAARIMASPESKIRQRLKEIAGMSHWLHVFKIACSKVYSSADLESLREEILAILDSLDAGDRAAEDAVVRSGALLAVNMLADGVPGAAPASKRNLMVRAMNLLGAANVNVPFLLERAIDASTLKPVEESITRHLREGGSRSQTNALRLLLLLLQSSDSVIAGSAAKLIKLSLPKNTEETLVLVNSVRLIPPEGAELDWLRSGLWRSKIAAVRQWSSLLTSADRQTSDNLSLRYLLGFEDHRMSNVSLTMIDGRSCDIDFKFRRIRDVVLIDKLPPDAHPQWQVLQAIGEFVRMPSPETLASFLTFLDAHPTESVPISEMPWIVLCALSLRDAGIPISEIVPGLEQNLWGGKGRWLELEQKWLKDGVRCSDFAPGPTPSPFFPGSFLTPTLSRTVRISRAMTAQFRADTFETVHQLSSDFPGSTDFSRKVLFWYLRVRPGLLVDQNTLLELHERAKAASSQLFVHREIKAIVNLAQEQFALDSMQESLATLVGKLDGLTQTPSLTVSKLITEFNKKPGQRFLLVLISVSLSLYNAQLRHIKNLDEVAFEGREDDTDLVKEAVTLLRLIRGDEGDISQLKTVAVPRLRNLLNHARISRDRATEVLRMVSYSRLNSSRMDMALTERAYQTLTDVVEKGKSRLADSAVYTALELPAPI